VAKRRPPDQVDTDTPFAGTASEASESRRKPSRKAVVRERKASGKPRAKQPGKAAVEIRSTDAPDGDAPLRIPFGNKEAALQLGARYRAGGWYVPTGVDLNSFRKRGWPPRE
jgi:DNA topoisomerase-3